MNKRLNFGGDRDHRLDTGVVLRIRYWEIRKVANGHESAADTDPLDGGTGKTCQCFYIFSFSVLPNRPQY